MHIDFFENGLCFYCHLAKNELITYADFHLETERLWKQKDELLQKEINSILGKYPKVTHDDIVESHGWDLHLNQIKYPDIHRTALVIAIYVFLENQLNELCKTVGISLNSKLRFNDLAGQGVERALLYLSKVGLFNLDVVQSLVFVRNVNRLRNNLIHAGGFLSDNPNDNLNRFVQDTKSLGGEPGGRLHISAEFIHELIDMLALFFDELDEQVKSFMAGVRKNSKKGKKAII